MALHLFTPRNWDGNERLRLQLNDEDEAKTRGRGIWRATVTDQQTGKRYEARSADCSLPRCHCDAIAFELKDGE